MTMMSVSVLLLSLLLLALSTASLATAISCVFEGVDYATINEGSALRKLIGAYTIFVAPCSDKLGQVSGYSTCSQASVCQCSTATPVRCWQLAALAMTPVYNRQSNGVVRSWQYGDSTLCSSPRVTYIYYQCAGYTTIQSVVESPACVYSITILTPLACSPPRPSLCEYNGSDYAHLSAGAFQPVVSGWFNSRSYQLSPCSDRINVVRRNSDCDGASVCRCPNDVPCVPLARLDLAQNFSRIAPDTVRSVTHLPSNIEACSMWTTVVDYRCAYATLMVSADDTSCRTTLVVDTPLACTSAPPLPMPSSSTPPPTPPTLPVVPLSSSSASASNQPIPTANDEGNTSMSSTILVVVVLASTIAAALVVAAVALCARQYRRRCVDVAPEGAFDYVLHSGQSDSRRADQPVELQLHVYAPSAR